MGTQNTSGQTCAKVARWRSNRPNQLPGAFGVAANAVVRLHLIGDRIASQPQINIARVWQGDRWVVAGRIVGQRTADFAGELNAFAAVAIAIFIGSDHEFNVIVLILAHKQANRLIASRDAPNEWLGHAGFNLEWSPRIKANLQRVRLGVGATCVGANVTEQAGEAACRAYADVWPNGTRNAIRDLHTSEAGIRDFAQRRIFRIPVEYHRHLGLGAVVIIQIQLIIDIKNAVVIIVGIVEIGAFEHIARAPFISLVKVGG